MKTLILFSRNGPRLEIEFDSKDNTVALKRKVSNITYIKEIRLELLQGSDILNNNEYIDHNVDSLEYREISCDENHVILEVKNNNLHIPELLQYSKYATIHDMKVNLSEITGGNGPFSIFTEKEELDDDVIIDDKLIHGSVIKICKRSDCNLDLSVTNIIPKESTFVVRCHILDKIAKIKNEIRAKLGFQFDKEVALFSDKEILEDEHSLIDYSLRNGSLVLYADLVSDRDDIEIASSSIYKGEFAKIYLGSSRSRNKKLAIKKFNVEKSKINVIKYLNYEIVTFTKLQIDNHERFIQLDSMFAEGRYFYICMEYMKEGSVADHLPVPEDKIVRYCTQILEALDYLHGNRIMYRNIKCSSVLLDNEDNIKLCNFHLSKYIFDHPPQISEDGDCASNTVNFNWAAPEVLGGEKYSTKADIWSVGATLIEMATGEMPYKGMFPSSISYKIFSERTIKYNRPIDISVNIDRIISLCIQSYPEDRPTAKELIEQIKHIYHL